MKKAKKTTPNHALIEARRLRNWSQKDVAAQLGVARYCISRWEQGNTRPGPYYRQRLCELFTMDPKSLGFLNGDEAEYASHDNHSSPEQADTLLQTEDDPQTESFLWHVPLPRNAFFTGRESVLGELHALLTYRSPSGVTLPVAVSGLGGIGKTQVALEYAYRYTSHYTAILWIRAENQDTLMTDLLSIASVLKIAHGGLEQDQIVKAIQRWLYEHDNWLLILDNVDDLNIMRTLLPPLRRGQVLLTTQLQATGTLAQRLALEPLNADEGVLFLLRRAKRIPHDEENIEGASIRERLEAQELVSLLGGLPLALDQAGAYIEESGCSLEEYILYIRNRTVELLARRGIIPDEHPTSLLSTLLLACERLSTFNPAAVEVLQLCAFLHPDAIPLELLRAGCAELGGPLQPLAVDPLMLEETLADIRRFSLLQRHSTQRAVSIHRLVQAILQERLEQETKIRWLEHIIHVLNGLFAEVDDIDLEPWHKYQHLLPHVFVCIDFILRWKIAIPSALELCRKAAVHLRMAAQYEQAEKLYKYALEQQIHRVGINPPVIAELLNGLLLLAYEQSRYAQAEAYGQQVLSLARQGQGIEDRCRATIFNDLLLLYTRQGKYDLAEEYGLQALRLRERMYGPEHMSVAATLNNLTLLYRRLGKYSEVQHMLERVIRICERTVGEDYPNLALSLNNLAILYMQQEQYSEAEKLYLRARAITEKTVGREHPNMAGILHCLGVLYRNQLRFDEAASCLHRAIAIRQAVLGPEHAMTTRTQYELGKLYLAMGREQQARVLLQEALAVQKRVLGSDHRDTRDTIQILEEMKQAQK